MSSTDNNDSAITLFLFLYTIKKINDVRNIPIASGEKLNIGNIDNAKKVAELINIQSTAIIFSLFSKKFFTIKYIFSAVRK